MTVPRDSVTVLYIVREGYGITLYRTDKDGHPPVFVPKYAILSLKTAYEPSLQDFTVCLVNLSLIPIIEL